MYRRRKLKRLVVMTTLSASLVLVFRGMINTARENAERPFPWHLEHNWPQTTQTAETTAERAKKKILNVTPNMTIAQNNRQHKVLSTTEMAISDLQAGFMNLETLDRDKALVLGHRKKERGFLTIGITTVKRMNASYLNQTLKSMIDCASSKERSEIRLVVFACDFEDKARQEARDIVSSFSEHLQSGLLQLIEAPRSFHPSFKNMKTTFKNPPQRVFWRSKENIDNVFLFAYSASMSDYYLQMDDDFTTQKGYLTRIRDLIRKHEKDKWIFLDISSQGTGKLFKNQDVMHVARYLGHFYQEMPVDWLINRLLKLHRQQRRFVIKPKLFYHMGHISSLEMKNKKKRQKQLLKDRAKHVKT